MRNCLNCHYFHTKECKHVCYRTDIETKCVNFRPIIKVILENIERQYKK